MTNSLIKQTVITRRPGVDAIPPVPALPARDVYEDRLVCRFRPVDSTGGGISGDAGGPGTVYSCQMEPTLVHYPATAGSPGRPGTPTTAESNFNLGWNAGGRSIKFFTADGHVSFQARPSIVGAIVGMNISDEVDGYNGTNIEHAFILSHGIARVMQSGSIVVSAGPYDESTVFKIERTDDTVTYLMGATTVHTSTGASTAPAWLEAALYSGGDEILNPQVVQVSAPDLTGVTGDLDVELPPMALRITEGMHAELNIELPALVPGLVSGLALPSYALLNIVLPPLGMWGGGVVGQVGTLDVQLPPLRLLLTDHPYGELAVSLPPFMAGLLATEGNNEATIGSAARATASMSAIGVLLAVMTSTGQVVTTMEADAIVPAEMRSTATGASIWELSAIEQAAMFSVASACALVGVPQSELEVWCINLDGMGTTQYRGYPFNSFAKLGNRYFGAGPGGLYALEGDTDAGALIQACIGLGELNFGSSQKKTVSEAYIGMASDGLLVLKVIAEGCEYLYRTRSQSEHMREQRVTLGKGLRTTYVTLELFNEDGADFDIDAIEFSVVNMTRRI